MANEVSFGLRVAASWHALVKHMEWMTEVDHQSITNETEQPRQSSGEREHHES
jgi:hypothetical protein